MAPHKLPLLSRKQAAAYLGVQPQTLALWASRGYPALPFFKLGGRTRYTYEELDALVQRSKRTNSGG